MIDNGIKVTKAQALDLLTQTGRTYWGGIRIDVTTSKGYTLPRHYDTLSFQQIEEIIDASTSRFYGSTNYLRCDSTTFVVMTLCFKVGNVTYSLHPCGHKG